MTLDGFIGRSDRVFDWTTPEDKLGYVTKEVAQHLVMGSTTLRTVQRFPQG
jgi:dihydrofolate reductase